MVPAGHFLSGQYLNALQDGLVFVNINEGVQQNLRVGSAEGALELVLLHSVKNLLEREVFGRDIFDVSAVSSEGEVGKEAQLGLIKVPVLRVGTVGVGPPMWEKQEGEVTYNVVRQELRGWDPDSRTTVTNLEDSVRVFGGNQDRLLSLGGEQFLHDHRLVAGHALALTHAEDAEEVEVVRVLLLDEPGDKIFDILFANAVHDTSVVAQQIAEHPRRVDVVADLGLEKGDVPGDIQTVLLRSSI